MNRICFIDSSRSRREAIIIALRPLLDDADILDPPTICTAALQHISPESIALVGFSRHDDAEFAVVGQLCDRGCTVLAYAHEWDRARPTTSSPYNPVA